MVKIKSYSRFLLKTLLLAPNLRKVFFFCGLFLRLQHQVKKHNLVVASYDVVRNDIDFFR